MAYHVYTRSGGGAFGIIVETAGEALAKAAQFIEDGIQMSFSRTCWETFSPMPRSQRWPKVKMFSVKPTA